MNTASGMTTPGAATAKGDRALFIEALARQHPVFADWARGPIPDAARKVTDQLCLMFFLLYLLAMIATGVWAFGNSNNDAFTKFYDSSHNICGRGAAKDYPILYLQTFSKPYRSVCVKKCPVFDYNQIKYFSRGVFDNNGDPTIQASSVKPLYFNEFSRKYAGNSYTYSNVLTEKEAFEYPAYWANGYFTEQQWNDYLARYELECLPNNQYQVCRQSPFFAIYDSYTAVRSVCTPLSPKAALLFNKVSARFNLGDVEDLVISIPLLAWTALISLGISLAFLILISLCPNFIVWILLSLTVLALLGLSGVLYGGLYGQGYLNNPINPLRVKYLQFWMDYKPLLTFIMILALIAAIFAIYYVFRYSKYIGTASHLIRLAARQTLREWLLIGFSLLTLILQILIFFLELWVIIRIYTTGKEINDSASGSPFVLYDLDWKRYLMLALHAFGLYWIMVVLNNLNDFVISGVVVDNYFTNTVVKPLHVLCHSIGYHLGSIAWSVIILPTLIIKYTLGSLDFFLTADRPNAIQRAGRSACSCCCWFYENFIDIISEKFMPITYIGSLDFFPATKTYYALSEIYADQVSVLLVVGDIISTCARIIVTLLGAYCGYLIYTHSIYYQQNVDNLWLLWICMLIIAYFVGSLFINLYVQTYDTTYVCYLIQLALRDKNYDVIGGPRELQDALAEYKSKSNTGANYRALP